MKICFDGLLKSYPGFPNLFGIHFEKKRFSLSGVPWLVVPRSFCVDNGREKTKIYIHAIAIEIGFCSWSFFHPKWEVHPSIASCE
ncbi:MAG: hypothetical protein ACE5HS_22975 [bacterium]